MSNKNKQIMKSVFIIIGINKGEVSVNQIEITSFVLQDRNGGDKTFNTEFEALTFIEEMNTPGNERNVNEFDFVEVKRVFI
jgi:hypothetical protein